MAKTERMPPIMAMDRHHCCYQRRFWDVGYARLICMAFVRYVPIEWHRELHARLSSVPVPPAYMLRVAWQKYQDNKRTIDSYDVCRALAWLYTHIPDVDFRKAIQYQLDFFTAKHQETV